MKEKMKLKEMQGVEKKGILRKVLPMATLLYALGGSPAEGYAQTLSSVDEGAISTVVGTPKVEEKKDTTIDLGTVMQGAVIKDDGVSVGDDVEKKPGTTGGGGDGKGKDPKNPEGGDVGEKGTSGIALHGMIQVGKIVIPDYADIASENPAALVCVDASHERTGLGVSVVRIEDFSKDPSNPASQVTVINPHWDKTFGKASVSVNSEFAFLDKLPEGNGVTAKVLGSYDLGKGWNLEGTYFHGFNKGLDSDAFRLGIAKKINEAWGLTVQGWYKSDYDKMFFGRIIMDINLGDGFGLQLSCVAKDGKLTPTMGVVYKF